AAPGKLLDLIDLYKQQMAAIHQTDDEAPFWMRHSQGDQWDLMLIAPIGSYPEYYKASRIEKRNQVDHSINFAEKQKQIVAWQEDLFVYGADLSEVKNAFSKSSYFHVEVFQALPGKHAELLQQREMENIYLETLNRPQNLIFVRDQGAGWDLFTLGFYRDIKHFAESADIPADQEDAAAKKAGFEAANRIGTYLRTLINRHQDTLAGAVN
ncbi:hypothetical protein IIC38_11225, partial [candidate division KSB1 bacterium]|nr:hypothetical protein [candidate division KSB1 bacterium]